MKSNAVNGFTLTGRLCPQTTRSAHPSFQPAGEAGSARAGDVAPGL